METFLHDLRYALRTLAKSPGFAAVAVLTIALGIGANTAIFSVVNAVMLRPLPYADSARVMILSEKSPQFDAMSVSYLNLLDWQNRNRSFSQLAGFRQESFNLAGVSTPERLPGRQVSTGFFAILGATPILGRDFLPEDGRAGAPPVVILSYRFWQRRFAGDPNIVSRVLVLNDVPHTVIGVIPQRFWFYSPSDVFVTFANASTLFTQVRENRSGAYVVGRLKPGVNLAQARSDMDRIASALAAEFPMANAGHGIVVKPVLEDVVGDVRANLLLLLGAVGFVLLIACVNVANLLLARSTARSKEIAIRAALGASRSRMVRQLLTESVLLAVFGGALGALLARWGTSLLIASVPGSLPRTEDVSPDFRVLLFTLGVSLLTGILFGIGPALRASRTDLHDSLKEGTRGSTSGRHRLQDALVVAELALTLVLLVGAGLTLRSILRLRGVNPGFDPRNALVFNTALSHQRYGEAAKVRSFYREALARLNQAPGVKAASLSLNVPMRHHSQIYFYVEGRPKPKAEDMPWAMHYLVSSGYADAMGLHILRGRYLSDQDAENSPQVIVIDELLARGLFPNEDAIGQRIIIPFPGFDQPREIVGVVNHVKHWGIAQDSQARIQYQFYMSFFQIPDALFKQVGTFDMTLLVRTAGDPRAFVGTAEAAIHALDPDLPVYAAQTMGEIVETSFAAQRFAGLLLGLFAGIALILAAVGIYGVMAYSVGQRTQEMGIRMALGATRRDILRLVLGRGSLLTFAGALIGLLACLGLTRFLASLLFGITATDPVTFLGVAFVLGAVALFACYVPARRATRVDPLIALRYE